LAVDKNDIFMYNVRNKAVLCLAYVKRPAFGLKNGRKETEDLDYMLSLFINVALFAALVIPGFVLGKLGRIHDGAQTTISNLLTDVAMPFLVLVKLLQTDFSALRVTNIIVCIVLPVVLVLAMYGLSLLVFPAKGERSRYAASRFCSIFSNCGFLGIPLAEALFPDDPSIVVYVALFNVFHTFMLLTLGIVILSGDRKNMNFRKTFVSPASFAIVLGVVLSLLNVPAHFPYVISYAAPLSQLTTPLSMVSLGFMLSKLKVGKMVKDKDLYVASALKLLVMPMLTLGVLLLLRLCGLSISLELSTGLFVATAVSTAASAPAMASGYGLDGEHAAALTLGSTILCVLTFPLVYMVFGLFF